MRRFKKVTMSGMNSKINERIEEYLESKFFNILGTGLSCGDVTFCRSTGHVGCLEIHSVIHDLQNACSQTGAYKKLLMKLFSQKK